MAPKDEGPQVDRRGFLTGVVAASAATALSSPARAADPAPVPRAPSARRPSMRAAAAETGTPRELARVPGVPGSDFWFFPAGITVCEYLTNLHEIGAERCRFLALPLKLEGADGCPVRAIAMVD